MLNRIALGVLAVCLTAAFRPGASIGPFSDVVRAEAWFREKGSRAALFDGDGLSDTAPDPLVRPYECQRVFRMTLNGVPFVLPRRNIMSYYDERDSLSPQQVARVVSVLKSRLQGGAPAARSGGISEK